MVRNEKIISVRAFAKEIGVSEGAVRKAIKTWAFTHGVQEDGKINSEIALEDSWVKKQLTAKAKPGVSRAKAFEKLDAQLAEETEKADISPEEDFQNIDLEGEDIATIASQIKVNTGLKAAEAMRRREIIALAVDKKKLQELEGILVSREAVEKSLFSFGNELKKALLNMPQRVVREIMEAPTEVEGINILVADLTTILEKFGSFKKDLRTNDRSK